MDFDPAFGRLGATNPNRAASELASEARRSMPRPEIDRAAVAPATERETYASPGLRPPGDFARDVILQLSPKALALAKSATTDPELIDEVDPDERDDDDDGDDAPGAHRDDDRQRGARELPTPRIDVRA
jgi:hypothetical protein